MSEVTVKSYGVWRNKKNQKLYRVFSEAINSTNALDGQQMVVYRSYQGDMETYYAREKSEFVEKFAQEEEPSTSKELI